jgi:GTPase SAR1 family protein
MEYLNYAQLIIGPAGSGKSTYCKIMQDHCENIKRTIKIINLDPAAEKFKYKCDLDIRELINIDEVMKKKKLGPNGALIYCMEYLYDNIEFLTEYFDSKGDNYYYLIDCPGQLELYSHSDIMKKITNYLKKNGFSIVSIFCLDCTFLQEQSKFISGNVLSLATMIQMELPHLTVMTKCDLISKSNLYNKIEDGIEMGDLIKELNNLMGKKMKKLNSALINFVENYSLVQFNTLNLNDENSISAVLYNADNVLQYFESQEPKDNFFDGAERDLNGINYDDRMDEDY